jgi:hypothetical protein
VGGFGGVFAQRKRAALCGFPVAVALVLCAGQHGLSLRVTAGDQVASPLGGRCYRSLAIPRGRPRSSQRGPFLWVCWLAVCGVALCVTTWLWRAVAVLYCG